MLTRRLFLGASTATALLTSSLVRAQIKVNPFTLGIASGAPRDTSVILWTRLAPDPLKGGGMPSSDVPVRYRVWADAEQRRLVRESEAVARASEGHSVHALIEGLQPGREYWYQFTVGAFETAIGRTRTSNRRDPSVKLAVASCQSWQSGYFNAFADMAAWAPDCVIHARVAQARAECSDDGEGQSGPLGQKAPEFIAGDGQKSRRENGFGSGGTRRLVEQEEHPAVRTQGRVVGQPGSALLGGIRDLRPHGRPVRQGDEGQRLDRRESNRDEDRQRGGERPDDPNQHGDPHTRFSCFDSTMATTTMSATSAASAMTFCLLWRNSVESPNAVATR